MTINEHDAAAIKAYVNDLGGMSDLDIDEEITKQTDILNEIEGWLEALHAETRRREALPAEERERIQAAHAERDARAKARMMDLDNLSRGQPFRVTLFTKGRT